jgi:hypothetical protein
MEWQNGSTILVEIVLILILDTIIRFPYLLIISAKIPTSIVFSNPTPSAINNRALAVGVLLEGVNWYSAALIAAFVAIVILSENIAEF